MWEDRLFLDQDMLPDQKRCQNLRLKFGIVTKSASIPKEIPSFTIVQGPFGDHVYYPASKESYFCWYPVSMKGMLITTKIPEKWDEACEGLISHEFRNELIRDNLKQFQKILPDLTTFEVKTVKGGIIVAEGNKDIDQIDSKLHLRNDRPIAYKDGYFSISTSKYTSAMRNTFLLEKILKEETYV